MGSVKGTTKSLGNKNKLDKFYTKPEIVKYCISLLNIENFDCIIEPSAGAGAFSSQIENCYAFDLEPENENIVQADWFTVDKSFTNNFQNVLVIGNPPFGAQGKLALAFIKEASLVADTIAFILPRSFKKDSIKNRIPLNFKLIKEIILPANSFLLEAEDYDVPSVFQVWEKVDTMREIIKKKNSSSLFSFVKDVNDADFRIQRVGGNAGKASIDLQGAASSNYFIKNLSILENDTFVNLINKIVFNNRDDVVGPRSLSKGDLVEEIEKAFINFSIDKKEKN